MPTRSPWRSLAVAIGALAAFAAFAAAPSNAAFGGSGRWLTYADGRVFVPHGLNVVVTQPPYYASWFGVDDAKLLASEGFTALRINFLPSELEPRPGAYDAAYLAHFVARAQLLARYGIAALPTLNQDGYSAGCGTDGFPAWMQVGDCDEVWEPFWENDEAEDGAGLIDHYLDWWRYALPRFADSPNVLGFDLLNEPDAPDEETLGSFWAGAAKALAPAAGGRLLFAERGAVGSAGYAAKPPAGTGFAGHVYCWPTLQKAFAQAKPTPAEIAACVAADRAVVREQLAFATEHGYPLIVDEFGASDELREQSALVDALGASFVPWVAYAYNARLDASGTPSQSILRDELEPASQANAKQAKLDALVVPYPMAVAGTPLTWRFDRASRVARFTYSTTPVRPLSGRPPTVVFVPQRVYRTGYRVDVSGARVVSAPTAPWLRLATTAGAARVTVTIRPRAGSTTLTPLQANLCGYNLRRCG